MFCHLIHSLHIINWTPQLLSSFILFIYTNGYTYTFRRFIKWEIHPISMNPTTDPIGFNTEPIGTRRNPIVYCRIWSDFGLWNPIKPLGLDLTEFRRNVRRNPMKKIKYHIVNICPWIMIMFTTWPTSIFRIFCRGFLPWEF